MPVYQTTWRHVSEAHNLQLSVVYDCSHLLLLCLFSMLLEVTASEVS